MYIFRKSLFIVVLLLSSLLITSCVGKSGEEKAELTSKELAFEIIKAYANDSTRREPLLRDYIDAGLVGAIQQKITLLNQKIKSLEPSQVDTTIELEAVYKQINLLPVIEMNESFNVLIPNKITINAKIIDLDDSVFTYEWHSFDDNEVKSTHKAFDFNAVDAGQFKFKLLVRDAHGGLAEKNFFVNVSKDQDPTADAGEDREAIAGQIVQLVGIGADKEGEVSYKWYEGEAVLWEDALFNYKSDVVGLHTIRLEVTDSFGNTAVDEVRVTIVSTQIKDTLPPVISLKGDNPYSVVEGQQYLEPGVVAIDNIDGDVVARVVVTGAPSFGDILKAGQEYRIRYNVSDSSGNKAVEKVRVLTIIKKNNPAENKVPVIRLRGDANVELVRGAVYSDLGAVAEDYKGGDITSLIVVSGLPIDVNAQVGTVFEVKYNVTDRAGMKALELVRTVTIVKPKDGVKPVITLIGESSIEVVKGESYIDQGATAVDDIDGVITDKIQTIGVPSSTDVPIGTHFEIKYEVTDAAGNAAVTVIRNLIVVAANTAPRILLYGMENVNMYQGERYDESGAYAIDAEEGVVSYKMTISGDYVDTSAAINTVFKVSFNVTDSDGNKAETIDKYVKIIAPGSMQIPAISERDKEMFLRLINERRTSGRKCGYGETGTGYVVDALTWNDSLYNAAYEHSQDVGRSDMAPGSPGSGTENDWTWVRNGRIEGGRSGEAERLNYYSYAGGNTVEISSRREDVTEEKIKRLFNIPSYCETLMSPGFSELGMSVYTQPTAYDRIKYVIRLGG